MGNTPTAEQRDAALSIAAEEGKVDQVGNLLKKGANPNRRLDDGERRHRTSLHRAAKTKNNVDVLTQLLDYIKDVDATDDDGNTALHLAAAYYNNSAFVHTLLHANPNCHIQNNKGQTAMHAAVANGSDWKVIELLSSHSDANIPDLDGNTPLHLCVSMRGTDAIIPGMLLRCGANPNLKNNKGMTALHLAAKSGSKSVLLLLKFHAKVRLKNKKGQKASDLAATEEIKRILMHEERCVAERTFRVDSAPPPMTSLSRDSMFNNVNNYTKNYYFDENGGLNGSGTYFWADDKQTWKEFGGDGVIHLPDKSDMVVPPQAVPHGTKLKVKISPSDEREDLDIPEFDFELYNFEFDVKVDLPGTLLFSPWLCGNGTPLSPLSPNSGVPPSFSGFCVDGNNRWKSIRELACQTNGVVSLHFRLSKEKGKPMTYKAPLPTRRSTTEVNIVRPTMTSPTREKNGHDGAIEEDTTDTLKDEESDSTLTTEEEPMEWNNKKEEGEEDEEKKVEEVSQEQVKEEEIQQEQAKEEEEKEEEIEDKDVKVEDVLNQEDVESALLEEMLHDTYARDSFEVELREDADVYEEEEPRYSHPIDPALDTIPEDGAGSFKDAKAHLSDDESSHSSHSSHSSKSSHSSHSSHRDDLTMDDVNDFQLAYQQMQD